MVIPLGFNIGGRLVATRAYSWSVSEFDPVTRTISGLHFIQNDKRPLVVEHPGRAVCLRRMETLRCICWKVHSASWSC